MLQLLVNTIEYNQLFSIILLSLQEFVSDMMYHGAVDGRCINHKSLNRKLSCNFRFR